LSTVEAILEAMTRMDRPWEDLHHRSYFLPEMRRIEAGEFTTTINGYYTYYVNPLAMHIIYVKGNMASISEMIPIDISRTPSIVENISSREDCSLKDIRYTLNYLKSSAEFFPGLMRRFHALTHV
jgi:hypothetical protein